MSTKKLIRDATRALSPRDEGNAITILLQNARRHIRRKVA